MALRRAPEEPAAAERYGRRKEGRRKPPAAARSAGPTARVPPADLRRRGRGRLSNRASARSTNLLEAAAPPRPTRAPGTEILARLSFPLFPDSSAEALPPAWASTCARGGRRVPNVSRAAGHRAERPPPRAVPLPGRPKLPEKGGGGWGLGRERAPAEMSVRPRRRHGGVSHTGTSALKFGELGSS